MSSVRLRSVALLISAAGASVWSFASIAGAGAAYQAAKWHELDSVQDLMIVLVPLFGLVLTIIPFALVRAGRNLLSISISVPLAITGAFISCVLFWPYQWPSLIA
jgi:hypothetical protein